MHAAQDHAFLQLCVTRRVIDKQVAHEAQRRGQRDGRPAAEVLVEMGALTLEVATALQREAQLAEMPPTIAGFRIIRKLGQGGMGAVYLAEQISLHREVALKVIAPHIANDAEAVKRFLREARIAASINHPNIVGVIDVGQEQNLLYMALELVTGGDAGQLAARFDDVLPETRALEIIADCCNGLNVLFENRLIHRDIKPSNIFIAKDGSAKLADLGLARSEQGDDRLTTTGFALGTPAFMSPEQANGSVALDIRSDIYALGATLFTLVTGRQPFIGNGPFAIAAKVLTEPAPDPRTYNPALSDETATLILRTLAKRPEDRFPTPLAMRAALLSAMARHTTPTTGQVPVSAPPTPTTTPTTPPPTPATAPRATPRQVPAAAPRVATRTTRRPRASRSSIPVVAKVLAGVAIAVVAVVLLQRGSTPKPVIHASNAAPPTPAATASTPAVSMPAPAPSKPPAPATQPSPSWASASGQDAHGRWADLTVGALVQRLRWIPPGRFTSGSPADEPARDPVEVQHAIVITRGFWLADSECSQGLWSAVMGSNPSTHTGDARLPVEQVSYEESEDFCQRLAQRHATPAIRLPTRAESEYACRASTTTSFSFGNDANAIATYANTRESGPGATIPVRSLAPNPWGLYDMHGNVCEWSRAILETGMEGVTTDPELTGGAVQFAIRGGCFGHDPMGCRSAAFGIMRPQTRNPDIGFRFLIEDARSSR